MKMNNSAIDLRLMPTCLHFQSRDSHRHVEALTAAVRVSTAVVPRMSRVVYNRCWGTCCQDTIGEGLFCWWPTAERRCQLHPNTVDGLLFVDGLKQWLLQTALLLLLLTDDILHCNIITWSRWHAIKPPPPSINRRLMKQWLRPADLLRAKSRRPIPKSLP